MKSIPNPCPPRPSLPVVVKQAEAAGVIIGIDRHKGSHAAVAVDATEAMQGRFGCGPGPNTGQCAKVWERRHRESSQQRNRLVRQLHAVLCDLIPGGFAGASPPARWNLCAAC